MQNALLHCYTTGRTALGLLLLLWQDAQPWQVALRAVAADCSRWFAASAAVVGAAFVVSALLPHAAPLVRLEC